MPYVIARWTMSLQLPTADNIIWTLFSHAEIPVKNTVLNTIVPFSSLGAG